MTSIVHIMHRLSVFFFFKCSIIDVLFPDRLGCTCMNIEQVCCLSYVVYFRQDHIDYHFPDVFILVLTKKISKFSGLPVPSTERVKSFGRRCFLLSGINRSLINFFCTVLIIVPCSNISLYRQSVSAFYTKNKKPGRTRI